MLNKIIAWAAKIIIGKQLVGSVNWLNDKLSGKRSEIIVGIQFLLWLLKHFGIVSGDTEAAADALSVALLGALPVTLAEKIKKVKDIAEIVVPKPAQPTEPIEPSPAK